MTKILKFKPASIVLSLVLVTGIMVLLPKLFDTNSEDARAGIPKIKGASDTGFDYEYDSASFKLLAGEDKIKQAPRFVVKQGARELDVKFVNVASDSTTQPTPTENPEATGSGDIVEEAPTVTPTPAPSLIPSLTPEEQPTGSLLESFSSRTIANAQTPTNTTGNITLIDTDAEQYVMYQKERFKIEPNQEKIVLDVELSEGEDLGYLSIDSNKLFPKKEEGDIIFQTRTNRHAFSFKGARLADSDGDTSHVDMEVTGKLSYQMNFLPDREWIEDPSRVFPLTLEVDLVSLFHDRMLPAFPIKGNFKASENLEFEIDSLFIDDANIKSALATDDLKGLKFGLIDPMGKQYLLDASVAQRDGTFLTLEFDRPAGNYQYGVFDLLIQYKDNSAYIAQEDFSWGVLAINPDMAVYPSRSLAKLDMAVLDKYGEMVCDADLLLTVAAPDGSVSERSTLDGSIEVSDTCQILMTDKPDYTTTYQTGSEGVYELSLSAVTDDGPFVIEDEFRVDDDSPFYVKRLGPTRIYPIEEYEMELEVTSATDSGKFVVEERVPGDFKLSTQDDAGIIQENTGSETVISWELEFPKGQTRTLVYTFDAPDVSPALFLVGPLEIRSTQEKQESDGETQEEVPALSGDIPAGSSVLFTEGRRWQIASDAIGVENSNSTSYVSTTNPTFTLTVSSATLLIVQVVNQGTGSVTVSDDASNTYSSIHSVTNADRLEVFYVNQPTGGSPLTITINGTSISGAAGAIGLTGTDTSTPYDTGSLNTCTQTGKTQTCAITADAGNWILSSAFSDSTATTYTHDASQTEFWDNSWSSGSDKGTGTGTYENASGGSDTQQHDAAGGNPSYGVSNVEINAAAVAGPTTDQCMRHCNWFDGGVEQGFFWAD